MYVKGDGIGIANEKSEQRYMNNQNIKDYFVRQLFVNFFKKVNLITVETDDGYKRLHDNRIFGIDLKNKVSLMYNGFDEDKLSEYNFRKKIFTEKENIILTVGRLGTFQKNTEMLLSAAEKLDWKNWKLVLIGTIDKKEGDFQKKIDDFYTNNPNLKDKVIFTGPIYNKEELWKWYNDSKVFVLSSRYEGFAHIFAEILQFRNYIISTDVGGAVEMIKQGLSYGEIIQQEDTIGLSQILQKIINGKINLEDMYNKTNWGTVDVSWEKYIRNAIKLKL